MFNIIDILGIIIVLISAIIALKKGFVKTFFSFISTFVALILAFALCNTGVDILRESTGIDEWLSETLETSLNSINEENVENEMEQIEHEHKESNLLTKTLENLPDNIKDMVGMEEYKENAKNVIIANATETILKILSWIIIYIFVRIVLLVVCIVCDGIMNIPFLKQINNLAGLICGAILGLFRLYLILAIVSFVTSVFSIDIIVEAIKNSVVISSMYENNILLSVIF